MTLREYIFSLCITHNLIYTHHMAYKPEIEALVLGALREGPLHGYRIAAAIKAKSEGVLKLGDNQIYPILHRLEEEGLVSAEWQTQLGKPARKVYALTASGSGRLETHKKNWLEYVSTFSSVIGADGVGNV